MRSPSSNPYPTMTLEQIRARPRIVYGLATGTAAAIAIMTIASPHPFIYFQF